MQKSSKILFLTITKAALLCGFCFFLSGNDSKSASAVHNFELYGWGTQVNLDDLFADYLALTDIFQNQDSVEMYNDPRMFLVETDKWADSILSSMSLEEKIGQLVFPALNATAENLRGNRWEKIENLIDKYFVGGFIYYDCDFDKVATMSNKLQHKSKTPLIISADFEYGVAMRVEGGTHFPTNMALGAANNPELIKQMGEIVAIESRALGVHYNFAPVSDVNNEHKNPIINVRSFGEQTSLVAELGNKMIEGMQTKNVIATAKHFPGHGNTSTDSHMGRTIVTGTLEQLSKIELVPFKENIGHGVLSVMVGHLSVPAIDPSGMPATLSKKIINDLLIEKLRFRGLVVTDAFTMKAITDNYSQGEAAVLAVEAGNDIILSPDDAIEVVEGLIDAVSKGRLTEERINHSARKILIAKRWLGLHNNRFVDENNYSKVLTNPDHVKISEKLAQESITLVKDDNSVLPFSNVISESKQLHIALLDSDNQKTADVFSQRIKALAGVESLVLTKSVNETLVAEAKEKIQQADIILLSAYLRVRDYSGTIGLPDSARELFEYILSSGKKVVVLAHGNPYVLSQYPQIATFVVNYGSAPESENALAEALYGVNPISGKLPISLPGTNYKIGDGQQLNSKLSQSISLGVKNILFQAIDDSTFPGAAAFVYHENGSKTIREFVTVGHYTYDKNSTPVSRSTLYDMASLTKVLATTNAVMRCIDLGYFSLDDAVSKYIPEFAANGKSGITVRNLLMHNSGLVAFRSFKRANLTNEKLFAEICKEKLQYTTGSKIVYSDLGFVTLAKLVERVSKKTFDQFCKEELFSKMGLENTLFAPGDKLKTKCAPTELDDYWRNRLIQGEVHDEMSSLFGGVAGHAGLFSNIEDVSNIAFMLLNGGEFAGKTILKKETVSLFTKRTPADGTRALGWEVQTSTNSSGEAFSNNAFGHTGFTGTSVWIDPDSRTIIVLLTNRVYPTRDNMKLISFRSEFHKKVIELLKR